MVVGRDNFVEDEYRGVCIDKGQMNCCVVVRLQSRVVLNRRLQRYTTRIGGGGGMLKNAKWGKGWRWQAIVYRGRDEYS